MKKTQKLMLTRETVRILSDLNKVVGGISRDCQSRIYQCAVPTSKQPWCDDTLSAGCPR